MRVKYADERMNGTIQAERHRAEKISIHVRELVAPTELRNMPIAVEAQQDHIAHAMAFQLSTFVLGHLEETRQIHWEARSPATWWDHWKTDHPWSVGRFRCSEPLMITERFHEEIPIHTRMCPHIASLCTKEDHFEWISRGSVNAAPYRGDGPA